MEKEKNIIFRVSSEDKKTIENRAEKTGLSLSKYVRKIALEGEIKQISDEEKKDLRAIGNNINQIAFHLNSRQDIESKTILKELEKTLKFLRNAYR